MFPYVFEITKTTTEMLNIALTALSVRDDYTDEEDLISKTFSQVLDLYKVKEPLQVTLFLFISVCFALDAFNSSEDVLLLQKLGILAQDTRLVFNL